MLLKVCSCTIVFHLRFGFFGCDDEKTMARKMISRFSLFIFVHLRHLVENAFEMLGEDEWNKLTSFLTASFDKIGIFLKGSF